MKIKIDRSRTPPGHPSGCGRFQPEGPNYHPVPQKPFRFRIPTLALKANIVAVVAVVVVATVVAAAVVAVVVVVAAALSEIDLKIGEPG